MRESLARQHAVVVGPGLGRSVRAGAAALDIIRWARELNKLYVCNVCTMYVWCQPRAMIIVNEYPCACMKLFVFNGIQVCIYNIFLIVLPLVNFVPMYVC